MMAINRRQLLLASASLLSFQCLAASPIQASSPSQLYASAYTDKSGQHFVALINAQGQLQSVSEVASRGHACAFSPNGQHIAFFARRPGRWLQVMDVNSGNVIHQISAAPGRHFYGHGCYDPSGKRLYCTENIYEDAIGIIGIYDVENGYRRIGEFESGGVGPHELAMLSDGKTLVVANGGIETHPDYGRRKLNLPTMAPNLSYIDVGQGSISEQVKPPHHQLSLRHLDVGPNDLVVVGAQYQGDPRDTHPLVFSHRKGEALVPMTGQSSTNQANLKQYIASIRFSHNGTYVLSSAPRGDRVTVWNTRDKSWLTELTISDVGGIAAIKGSSDLLLSTGKGELYRWTSPKNTLDKISEHGLHWDNHMFQL